MQQLVQQSQNLYEGAGAREQTLRTHREQRGALSIAESEVVARTATGEQVELDPVRITSVHEIYNHIRRNFDKKDQAQRQAGLLELQTTLGVEVDTTLPESTVDDSLDRAATTDTELNTLIHQLAEDIYDALERTQKTIAIIKPASIGDKTISRLRHPADANFLVESNEGEKLYEALQAQATDFRVVKKNGYGFVIENKELGFSAMFIFQERVTATGELITQEAAPEEQGDEGTQTAAVIPTATASNPSEN